MAINNNYNNWSVGNSIENYNAKDWVTGELIRELALDNIENGINDNRTLLQKINTVLNNINSNNSDARISELENKIGKNVTLNNYANVITAINTLETRTNNLDEQGLINRVTASISNTLQTALTDAQNEIDNKLSTFNNTINSLVTKQDIYGSNTVNNEGQASFKAWVSNQITALGIETIQSNINSLSNRTTALEGQIGNGSGSGTLTSRVAALETSDDNIQSSINNIQSLIGTYYYNNGTITQYEKTITTRLYDLENTTVDLTVVEQALGRKLTYTQEDPAPDNIASTPLLTTIRNILEALGMEGGASSGENNSSLIQDVNTALTLLYGYTITTTEEEDPENPGQIIEKQVIVRNSKPDLTSTALIKSYPELYSDFYSLSVTIDNEQETITQSIPTLVQDMYPTVRSHETSINQLTTAVSNVSSAISRANEAYIDATTEEIGENSYLVLQRNPEANMPTQETDIQNNEYENNTFLILPKGGGGGTAAYSYYSTFIVDRTDENPTVAYGDNYIISYKWVTKDSDTREDSAGINGTINVYNNNILVYTGAITSVVTESSYATLDVSNYLSLGENTFRITVTSNVTALKSFYYTINCVSPQLTSNFDSSTVQLNNTILFSFTMTIGSTTIAKTLHVLVDGIEQTISNYSATSERLQSITFTTPSAGAHLLKVYFTSIINGNSITSNILKYGIICGTSNDTRIATDFENGTILTQYDILSLNYLVVTPNVSFSPISIIVTDGEINYTDYINNNVPATTQKWSYSLNIPFSQNEESKNLTIIFTSNGTTITRTFILNKNNLYDFSPITTNLQLYMNADQKSNNTASKTIWENTSPATDAIPTTATLNNFLYYSNVDGWQVDDDGKYFLRLRNNARALIPFNIFPGTPSEISTIASSGMTFEIDFRTSDVLNYDTRCIACYDSNPSSGDSERGIILTPQNAKFAVGTAAAVGEEGLSTINLLNTYYKEEEKMTLAFVITPTTGNTNTKENSLMYVYINGILSGATQYNNLISLNNGIIELGSNQCTTDIYSIRYYPRALGYRDIIQNWISNEGNLNTRVELYNKNTYTAVNDTQLFEQFKLKSPQTPYMVIMGAGDLNNTAIMPAQKGSDYAKDVQFYFNDPLNPANNIGAISSSNEDQTLINQYGIGAMKIQVQGTSSQYYYRKNYKLKFTQFTQDGILHKSKKTLTDDDYDIVMENDVEVSRTLKEGLSKNGYKLSSTSYPTWSFCIKADVASSESANNTLLTMLYDSLSRSFYRTPPQEQNSSIRQGVEGRPVVAWYYNTVDKTYTLLGKYNFNNDKGTHEVFGLEEVANEPWAKDQSWEVKNNGISPLTLFNYTDAAWENWSDGFEARFPDQDDTVEALTGIEDNTDITTVSAEDRAKWTAGLKQVIKWVNDKVQLTEFVEGSGKDIEATDACIAGFKSEFENYFNLRAMLFFYVFTEYFLMVDNRAKNMFLTRYLITSERPSSYNTTQLTKDGTNVGEYFGWFTFPYDFDTGIGIDNNGRIRFDYHYEDSDLQPNGTSIVFNGQRSKLWKAFKKAYATEIANTYRQIYANLSYENVEPLFESHQAIWSEAIFNEDMIHKYIEWGPEYLYMLLGSKKSHRQWWLSNRARYFNSKYQVGEGTDRIYLRIEPGNNYTLSFSTYADSYINFKIGANGTPQTARVLRGATESISFEANASQQSTSASGIDGVETVIYPASSLNSITGLAALNIREADFSQASKLETLALGDGTTINTSLTQLNLGTNNTTLRHFDMRNYQAYSAELDLSNYISLETAYLAGSSISVVTLPSGGVLQTIQYPTTITSIQIINQPYLENLIIGAYMPTDNYVNDYSNITSIVLDNINENIDIPAMVIEATNLSNCSLSNLTFHMTSEAFRTFFNKLVEVNATIVNCTIYLETAMPSDFTVSDITSKFDFKVYGKTEEGYAEYYNVRFYGFSNELISTSSVVNGASIDGPTSYFTDEYLDNYNGLTEENKPEHPTRIGFGGWNPSPVNIQSDLSVRPIPRNEYRMEYHYLDENAQQKITYTYLAAGEEITGITINNFIKDYYTYKLKYWTSDSNEPANYPNDDVRENVYANTTIVNKQAIVEAWYAVYSHEEPAIYDISIYNTNINGEKVGEPIAVLKRTVIAGTTVGNTVTMSNLEQYKPTVNVLAAEGSNELNTPLENRKYQFLSWKPRIDSNFNLRVTGNQDILLTYYKTDDYYTNYFLNKLIKCNLDIASINDGAFYHNTNFVKLQTTATTIGKYCFANFTDSNIRNYFIFDGEGDITLGDYCFYGINNAIIIFNNTGHIIVNRDCFYRATNCIIITRNATLPIINATDSTGSFYNFLNSSNTLYVNSTIYDNIYNSTNANNYSIPTYLINTAKERIVPITTNNQAAINSLIEEANNA